MDSIPAKAFLSQVFDPRISKSLKTVEAICKGLDIETVWVDRTSPDTPATMAAEKIESSDFLIAFCSRKTKLEGKGSFHTSTAVREEIAIAKAKGKNVVCFVEDGVEADGFQGNMFTYGTIADMGDLQPNEFFDVTQAIHNAKLRSLKNPDDVMHATGIRNFHISDFTMRLELLDGPEGLYWDYIIEKIYKFENDHEYPISLSAFCLEASLSSQPPKWQVEYLLNNSSIEPSITNKTANNSVELKSIFDPHLKKGDSLFSRERYRSPWLSPIHGGQETQCAIDIAGVAYGAYDGISVINRIQKLKLVFVFPRGYELAGLKPLVATVSWSLDHVNQIEMDRLTKEDCLKTETFDGRTTATLTVDRPLYQYFYGLAWKLPPESKVRQKIATVAPNW